MTKTKLEIIAEKYNVSEYYEPSLDVINLYLNECKIDNVSRLALAITADLNENRNNELYITYYTNDFDEPIITISEITNVSNL